MRKDPIRMVWKIECETTLDIQRVKILLEEKTNPDAVFVDSISFDPRDQRERQETLYRFGDSFNSTEIVPLPDNTYALQLTFDRRLDAPRYWKNIMVRILGMARDAAKNVTVDFVQRIDLDQPTQVPVATK